MSDARVSSWVDQKLKFQMMTQLGAAGYACPACWDWPTVYKCSGRSCVADPTGLGGYTKSDCGGKCRLSTGRQVLDDAPQWEKRADDLMAVPGSCRLSSTTGFNIKCFGQIGSPSAYGAIYQVKLPDFDARGVPSKTYSGTSIVGKCMITAPSNAKEQMLAKEASDLVAGAICAYFPLLVGVATGCSVALRETHPAARRARKLGIPLPEVRDMMYSELASGDMIMWTKAPHTVEEWKRVYFQVFSAIEFMQSYLNIIHNDLHGGNVLLASDGTALIHDFGLSKVIGSGPNTTGRTSTAWVPEDRFIDYKRACGMRNWAGTPDPGGYGGVAAPREIKDIFDACGVEMRRAFMFYARPTNDAAIACARRMRELWRPSTPMYRAPSRLALIDGACNSACASAGVLNPDTLACDIDQTLYPGVQCCQSSLSDGCVCAGSAECVQPTYPDEPAFTLKLVKSNGTGTLDVGVAFWAGQTILVCMHSDAQPAKFQFVPSSTDNGKVYLQIFQSAFGPAQYPPTERNAAPNAPLYIRNGPPNYGGEQEGYTYVTTNLADATQFNITPVDENTGKFQLSVVVQRTPTYSTTEYLHSDDGGNSLMLIASPQMVSTFQAVIEEPTTPNRRR